METPCEELYKEKEQALLLFCTVVSNVGGDGIKKMMKPVLPLGSSRCGPELQQSRGTDQDSGLGPGTGGAGQGDSQPVHDSQGRAEKVEVINHVFKIQIYKAIEGYWCGMVQSRYF